MALSIQEKLALMLTLTKTQQQLADFTGIKRGSLSKWIKSGLPDNNGNLRYAEPTKSDDIDAINTAFGIYKDVTKAQSKVWNLPYDPQLPVYIERLYLPDETIGDRAIVGSSHFLSDKLRNRIIAFLHNSRRFIAASIKSLVNLQAYNENANKRAENRQSRFRRGPKEFGVQREFEIRQQLGQKTKAINTPLEQMNGRRTTQELLQGINDALRERHQPAIVNSHNLYATEYLFQVDGNNDELSQAARKLRAANKRQARAIYEKARRAKAKSGRIRKAK